MSDYDEPRDEALEERIAADPSPESYRVYSDWLQQHDNPRGELIAVQTAMETATGPEWAKLKVRELELFDAHDAQLFGPLKKWKAARRSELVWKRGFIRGLTGHSFREVMMELFAHPSARFIERVLVDDTDELNVHPNQPFTEVVTTGEKLDPVFALPRLKQLSMGRSTWAGELSHDGLERLSWARPHHKWWPKMLAARLPKLKRFSAWISDDTVEIASEVLAKFPLEVARLEVDNIPEQVPRMHPGAAGKVGRLALHDTPTAWLGGLPDAFFSGVTTLELDSITNPEAGAYFELMPVLPKLSRVRLVHPTDRVRWFRGFAESRLAKQVEALELGVSKPEPGVAIASYEFPRLRSLDVRFDASSTPQFLQSAQFFAGPAWKQVRVLELNAAGHVVTLAASALGASLEELTVRLETDREGELLLEHVAKLKALKVLRLRGERVAEPAVIARLFALPLKVEWLGNRLKSVWD